MRSRTLLIAALYAFVSCGGSPQSQPSTSSASAAPPTGTITIFAASSLTHAFHRVGDELTRMYPATRYIFNYGSSSTLATQIVNGAPADVFASADDQNLQKVVDAALVQGSASIFA